MINPPIIEVKKPVGPVNTLLGQVRIIDSRSTNWFHWPWENEIPTFGPKVWAPNIPILDQSNLKSQQIFTSEIVAGVSSDEDALGSCTGNATLYAASVICGVDAIEKAGFDLENAKLSEQTAIQWYSRFTYADEWLTDNWPSTDCGSSGLGACRTLQKVYGLIRSYRWAKNAEALCSMLQGGPVIMGMPWYNSFFETDKNGFIDSAGWEGSGHAGGHEICIGALDKVVQKSDGTIDTRKSVVAFPNSWGTTWGDDGWGRMRLSTYQKLKSNIDVAQFSA